MPSDHDDKKPINPFLAILGNAIQSSQKDNLTKPGTETITCKSCGAARPNDTNLQFCDYCGYQFFE